MTRDRLMFTTVISLIVWLILPASQLFGLDTINLAIPTKSFQQVIYPLAQDRGYMREEGIDLKIVFVEPTPSIQAALAGSVHFTAAGNQLLFDEVRKAVGGDW